MRMGTMIFRAIDLLTGALMNPDHLEHVICQEYENYDLYYVDDHPTTPKPIIINIHGGGFMAGDKKYRRYWCEVLADDGWFVINANYRLCPAVTIIEQIKDVWTVCEAALNLADEYQLDTNTIVVTGDSSGAFQAAYMVALTTNPALCARLGLTPNPKLRFAGALLYSGAYDLPQMLETATKAQIPLLKSMAEDLCGQKYKNLGEVKNFPYYHELSIPNQINAAWPPVQLFYSKHDIFVKGQGELFFDALVAHGIPVRRHFTERLTDNHCYHLFFLTRASKVSLQITKKFLDQIRQHQPFKPGTPDN